MTPHLGRVLPVLAGAILATALVATATASSTAFAEDDSDGTKLVITVIAPSASPSATPTSTKTATPTGSATTSSGFPPPSGSGVGTTTADPSVEPTDPSGTPAPEDADDGAGVLHVSGLSWTYRASINPFAGTVDLRLTVRNVYPQAIDASATFWVTQLFGGTVGLPVEIAVPELKPEETRTVTATIEGIGQWTVLNAHATLTPPAMVDDIEMSPIVRETWVWVVPWFALLLAAAGAAWIIVRRRLRSAGDAAVAADGELVG